MTAPLYKGKGDRTECKNCRGISLLSVDTKIYTGILIGRVRRVTKDLIKVEQRVFQIKEQCVDKVFTLKQIGEKGREKRKKVYVGFMDLENVYDRVDRLIW